MVLVNMEMPTSCWQCPLSVLYEKPRELLRCKITKDEVLRHKIDGNCPLIPVPPHGRLIDADVLTKQMERNLWAIEDKAEKELGFDETLRRGMQYGHAVCLNAVNDAPTIIPASEDGAKTEEDTEPWLCLSCRHYPPSSTDGKPCTQCDPSEVWHSCYDPAEEGE